MPNWGVNKDVPKNVPIIKVRQQWTTKCGETCAGRGHGREKRYPPCGPSPPSTEAQDLTCGLPDCFEEDTCRCRCACALKELMRQHEQERPPTAGDMSVDHVSVPDRPLVHVAEIHTLEPNTQPAGCTTCYWNCYENPYEEVTNGFRSNGVPCCVPQPAGSLELLKLQAAAAETEANGGAPDPKSNGNGAQSRPPDLGDPGPDARPSEASTTPSVASGGAAISSRGRGAAKKYRVPKTSGYQRWFPRWWYTYGGAPPEPCRGGHCFFGSPARTFPRTADVLGELPEWGLEPIARVCRTCIDGPKKIYCPRRRNSKTGRVSDNEVRKRTGLRICQ